MSDSKLAHYVHPEPEHEAKATSCRRSHAQRCRFCDRENIGDVVDAGGDVGRVHRACFIEWDRAEEALEAAAMVTLSLPDPGEEWTERELDEAIDASRAA
jgi:hypothetical protein